MIESWDDSDEREARAAAKDLKAVLKAERDEYAARLQAYRDTLVHHAPAGHRRAEPGPCPYCTAAKKGGAHGDRDHEVNGVVHKVRVVSTDPIVGKNCLSLWVLAAACGAEFNWLADSSD